MHNVRLGELTVRKVFETEAALPFPMALPDISVSDLQAMKCWYWSDELSLDPEQAYFKLSVHTYVIQLDGLNILVDTCNGNNKIRSVPFADRLQTSYLDNLAAAGLRPGDVDLVMCTHLHCDHVGWNTQLSNGRWVPTFPNARYIFSRRDYEFFNCQTDEELHRTAFEDSIRPVVEAGLADLVELENNAAVHRELGDGVWLEDARGHSPGCCVINAQRKGPLAVFSGDVFHHPVQLERPDMPFFADHDPEQAVESRMRLLETHADTESVFFPAHFTGVSAGRIRRRGDRFRYEFLET